MSEAAALSKPQSAKATGRPAPASRVRTPAPVSAVPAYLQAKFAGGAVQCTPAPEGLPEEEKREELEVQPSLAVGPADDAYEREADAVSERVMRSPATGPVSPPVKVTPLHGGPRRKADGPCPGCGGALEEEPEVQRKSALAPVLEEEEPLQMKPAASALVPDEELLPPVQAKGEGGGSPAVTAAVRSAVGSPGPGSALSPGVRSRVEPVLGSDLGPVRVHHDARAREAAGSIQARAFTQGADIWLGPGESPNDLGLMAHEATHVVQQRADIRRKPAQQGGAPAAGNTGSGGGGGSGAQAAGSGSAPTSASPPAAASAAPAATGGQGPAAGAAAAQTGGGGQSGGAQQEGGGGASSGEAAAAAPATGGEGGGIDLLMPEPPEGLSPEERARIERAEDQADAAADANEAMPAAGETVADSRAAVAEPEAEANARAAAALTETLGERAAPSPEIEDLCTRIRELIRSQRPPDEESLVQFDPRAAAQASGDALNTSVQGDAERVQGDYEQLEGEPTGTPAPAAAPLETPPASVETPPVNATQAVPNAVPAENVSLDADVAAGQQRIEDAGMSTEPAGLIDDPSNPVVQAREAQGELGAVAARAPAEVLAEQSAIREQARGEMQSLQAQALRSLQSSRAATAEQTGTGMRDLGTTEDQMRTNAAAEAQRIFNEAQGQVTTLLTPLPRTAMTRWETGIQVLSTRVEQQSEEFNRWKRERYEGIGGTALEVVEYFTGLPDWAIRWLNGIETSFGNDVCDLIREISSEVNSVIASCEEIIDNANTRIAAVFAELPASLQDWAAGEQAGFSAQLEGLRERAQNTREDFNRDLTSQAAQAVQDVRERIHAMRQEAQGLFGRIAAAVEQFADDPARFIINGLLKLVGISPGSFWALVDRIGAVIDAIADDPLSFAGNLATAIGQGFQRFFDNFGTHILGGFFDWLTSALGSVGVTLPTDFSPGSLIRFFLELMGITWARIREILARHIGEENVALLERAYELIATLMEQGVDGIVQMIGDALSPSAILDAVISAAVDFLIEALIRAVTPRIIALFNPAGAIAQAIEVIYRILAWVFDNAARIFTLVETVVNGAAQLVAGNTAGMAAAVEGALARIIAPVIDFLAGFLGLGDLPERIADTIRSFQEMVLAAIERVVGFIAERARALLRALGVGGEEGDEDAEDTDYSDHRAVAERAKRELESDVGDGRSYEQLRAAKEAQARAMEQSYSARLEDGIGLSVIFAPASSDASDRDIDFEIRIAPNTTTTSGEVELPESTIDVFTIFADAQALGGPQTPEPDEVPVTRLNPASVRHGKQQIIEAFSAGNVPAGAADAALATIDQLLDRALDETTARGIEMRIRSVVGIANGLLREGGSGILLNAHHSQRVAEHPGTFTESRMERMDIPARVRREIEQWLRDNPGVTKQSSEYSFIVSVVREHIFEARHPHLETPLGWVDLIIATVRRHRALHAMD